MDNGPAIYLGITTLNALGCFYAAFLDFTGAASVKLIADRLEVPHKFMIPLGTLLAAGGLGLLVGMVIPEIGAVAAGGLILYFICAIAAHVRVRDWNIAGATLFLILAVFSLWTNIAYHQLLSRTIF